MFCQGTEWERRGTRVCGQEGQRTPECWRLAGGHERLLLYRRVRIAPRNRGGYMTEGGLYSAVICVPCVNGGDQAGDGAGEIEGSRVGRNERTAGRKERRAPGFHLMEIRALTGTSRIALLRACRAQVPG